MRSAHTRISALLFMSVLVHFELLHGMNQEAERPGGTVIGKIIDADTGLPLMHAAVTVRGAARGGVSDKEGSFLIDSIPAGLYALRASLIGYRGQQKDSVNVLARQTTQASFSLLNERPDSLTWVMRANKDIARGEIHLLTYGLMILSVPESVLTCVANKYGFHYQDERTDSNDGCQIYNEVVCKYLDKLNGAGWRGRFEQELQQYKRK
jgi:hypothetical protein